MCWVVLSQQPEPSSLALPLRQCCAQFAQYMWGSEEGRDELIDCISAFALYLHYTPSTILEADRPTQDFSISSHFFCRTFQSTPNFNPHSTIRFNWLNTWASGHFYNLALLFPLHSLTWTFAWKSLIIQPLRFQLLTFPFSVLFSTHHSSQV